MAGASFLYHQCSGPLTHPAEAEIKESYFLRRQKFVAYAASLHLLHANPFRADAGGTERYVMDLLSAAKLPRALLVYPEPGAVLVAEVLLGDIQAPLFHRYRLSSPTPKVCLESCEATEILRNILDCFHVRLAHIHHLFHWPISSWRTFRDARIPFFYTVHDFYCLCPNNNLFDHSSLRVCACNLEETQTKRCLRAFERAAGVVLKGYGSDAVRRHRQEFAAMLTAAEGVVFPSVRALEIVQERYPGLPIKSHVVPHGLDGPHGIPPRTAGSSLLRVGVIGSVGYPAKGAEHYVDLVRRTRDHPIEWHFFGDLGPFNYKARLLETGEAQNLVFHGFYHRTEISELLWRHGIDVVVNAPAAHETFSFTLSEALCSAIPVIAIRLGALEERLKAAGLAELLVDGPAEAASLLINFASTPELIRPLREKVEAFRHPTVRQSAESLLQIYGAAGWRLFETGEPPDHERQVRSFQAHQASVEAADADRLAILRVEHSGGPWWYRLGRRFDEVLPAQIQRPLRRHFMNRHWEVLTEFTFSRRQDFQILSAEVELLGFRFGYPVFRAKGSRPFMALPPRILDPKAVQIVRFRIRAMTETIACAKLFWVHGAEEDFSEEKAIAIPLERTRRWQDVIIDLRRWPGRGRWLAGPQISAMRLLPLNCPGRFQLDGLWLARVR